MFLVKSFHEGGLMMYPILALGVVMVYISLERLFVLY
jgi:hypothetical protein